MAIFNGDLSAARQELVDRLNAKISTTIPFIQKRVNLGRGQVTKANREHGIMEFYVPASGNAQVGQVSYPVGTSPYPDALNLSGRSRKSSFYKKTCYAQNASDILEYSSFEEIFALDDVKKDFIIPRGERMANEIEKNIVERNCFKAGGAIVSATADFLALSKASAELKSIKALGDWTGYLSPMLESYLSTSPLRMAFRAPDKRIEEMYGKASIGYYANVDWVEEPFMPVFTSGDALGSSAKIKAAVSTQGATQVVITGLTASTAIKKGTPITIDGVYEVTMSGVKQSYLKKFIIQEDATADANGDATVTLLPIYFNGPDGYTNNVWVAPVGTPAVYGISANAAVKMLVDASTDYYIGLVRDSEAFNWTPFEWPELLALENYTTSTDELTIQIAGGANIEGRTNVIRMDVPFFGDIVDERAVRTLYVKVP